MTQCLQQKEKGGGGSKSFASVKHVFRSSVQYKGYFLLETCQKRTETVRRLPVGLEVHSEFSQALKPFCNWQLGRDAFSMGFLLQ